MALQTHMLILGAVKSLSLSLLRTAVYVSVTYSASLGIRM